MSSGASTTTAAVGDASKEGSPTAEDVPRDKLFEGSTIQFLFVDEIEEAKRPVHAYDVGLAIFVVVVQMSLYVYLTRDAQSNIEADSVVVQISHGDCGEEDFSELTCEAAEGGLSSMVSVMSGMCVMTCFIMSDIAAALYALFKVSCSSNKTGLKIAGILMLIKNLLAVLCGAYLARLGVVSSGADVLLGCVGVVFIHEMDEKTRLVYAFARKFRQFLVLFVLLVIFEFAMVLAIVFTTD